MTRDTRSPRRPFWALTAREAGAHAAIACVALWSVAAWMVLAPPGPRDRFGHLKGADFVHFYTLGRASAERRAGLLYDVDALDRLQTSLVPASRGDRFLPVYPPQVALVFAPLALVPFGLAAVIWAALTAAAYGAVTWSAAQSLIRLGADRKLIAFAALGAPAFWYLLLHGQSTLIPMVGVGLAGAALHRGRRFAAGLALGLLAAKPQLGLVLGAVLLAAREWRIVAGSLVAFVLQAGAVYWWWGAGAFVEYGQVLAQLPAMANALEPRPYQLHSWRAVAAVEGPVREAIWVAAFGALAWMASRAWRSPHVPVAARFGILILASVLGSAHATVYDLALLTPAVAWIGGWVEQQWPNPPRRRFWGLVYLSWPLLLVPTSLWLGVQASVLVLTGLLVVIIRARPADLAQ